MALSSSQRKPTSIDAWIALLDEVNRTRSIDALCTLPMQGNSSSKPRGPWTRKPISLIVREQNDATRDGSSQRHLGLFDLVSIGVGGTVGSGIFVLAGFIAHHYAGPATFISFIISGVAASCSGLCYAEFAGRLPASGSTYIYSFVSMGEWAAIISGACLTLEYGVSGAAGEKSNSFALSGAFTRLMNIHLLKQSCKSLG